MPITNIDADSIFIGREVEMEAIEKGLKEKSLVVIQGPPGIGKTALASEYARRHAKQYLVTWRLHCGGGSSLGADLVDLAERLGLPMDAGVSGMMRNDVRRALRAEGEWLLILDDVSKAVEIREWLEQDSGGHIIATSADGNWEGAGAQIHLQPLRREQSVKMLQAISGSTQAGTDASTLAMALAELPIAISLAGRLMKSAGLSYKLYLKRFESLWGEILIESQPGQTPRAPGGLAMACELSTLHAAERMPESKDLLTLCAFFGETGVSLDILRNYFAEGQDLEAIVHFLATLGLIESQDRRNIRLHASVARMVRAGLNEENRDVMARTAMQLATEAFGYPSDMPGARARAAAALPLVLTTAYAVDELGTNPGAVSLAMHNAGQFLLDIGRYELASTVLKRAHSIASYLYGENDSRLTAITDVLGRALSRAGDLDAARAHFEKAIEADSATYGYDDPRVASLVNNYARCHFVGGDIQTARQQYEWALNVIQRHYGEEHQRVAAVINNIGYTHATAGDMAEARTHLENALELADRTYPVNHPDVARVASNLGRIVLAQGEVDRARDLLERALLIDRDANGYDHPEVGRDLFSLGDCARAAADHATAERYYAQAVSVAESSHSPAVDELLLYLDRLTETRKTLCDEEGVRQCAERSRMLRTWRDSQVPAVFAQ